MVLPQHARMKTWVSRHRPSGIVTAFMAFFLVSYYVITKLDKTDTIKTMEVIEPVPVPKPMTNVIRTQMNVIPLNILQEFAQDEENAAARKANYDFYDDLDNYTDYQSKKKQGFIPQVDYKGGVKLEVQQNASVMIVELRRKFNRSSGHKVESHRNQMKLQLPNLRNTNIRVYNVLEESKSKQDSIQKYKCVLLKTLHGEAPICIHNPHDDEIISGKLSTDGIWEGNYLYIVGSILSSNPNLEFLDLGCNIGVYTILAAKLGHRVVALDPNSLNLRLLTKSLNMGTLSNRVTLLRNAISNVQENVTLFDILGNIGGTFVETADKTDQEDDSIDSEHKALAITLDELTDIFRNKQLFIKIDVETYELKALKGGNKFFMSVDVRYVLMEWIYHREFDTGKEVIKFMKTHNLFPHINAHRNTKLDPEYYRTWPDNVLWIKY